MSGRILPGPTQYEVLLTCSMAMHFFFSLTFAVFVPAFTHDSLSFTAILLWKWAPFMFPQKYLLSKGTLSGSFERLWNYGEQNTLGNNLLHYWLYGPCQHSLIHISSPYILLKNIYFLLDLKRQFFSNCLTK